MPRPARLPVFLLLFLCVVGSTRLLAAETRRSLAGPIQGVIISTHGDGRDWGHDEMLPTMRDLKELGAEWVAIHPYAGIRGDGRVKRWDFGDGDPPAHIVRPIQIAHSLGLKILIKPHLAYWGSPFDWRGEIAFDREEHWRRFWTDYERWIVWLAGAAHEADAFVVGTELDLTLAHEKEWRRLIGAVRARTKAPLTYAANWSDFERVPFWDALDAVGVHAYFPLTENSGAAEADIRAGWATWMQRLSAFAEQKKRPILFAELGYTHSTSAPVKPWEPRAEGEGGAAMQELCMRVALEAVREEPAVVGAFLWKWFPQPYSRGRNFQLATPGMQRVIRDAWD